MRSLGSFCKHLKKPVWSTPTLMNALASRMMTGEHLNGYRHQMEEGWNWVVPGRIEARYFEVPHDARQTVGYAIRLDGYSFLIMTDVGRVTEEAEDLARDASSVVIESNYDPYMLSHSSYPEELRVRIRNGHGHLSNEECAEAVAGFAVAHVSEGLALRNAGITKDILVMSSALPWQLSAAVEANLTLACGRAGFASELQAAAEAAGKPAAIHIKIDTGLHRIGFAPEEQKSADAQFAAVKAAVIAELRRTFRPEFLNRVDETIVFRRLSREDCAEIARRLLAQTVSRAAALGITLEADEDCAVSLAERGYDVSYGARPLRRLIRSEVEDALATCLLDGTLASGDTAVLAAENGTLCVRRREKAAAAALGDVGAQKA